MKFAVTIALIFFTLGASGQDSLIHRVDTTVTLSHEKIDSLRTNVDSRIDSIEAINQKLKKTLTVSGNFTNPAILPDTLGDKLNRYSSAIGGAAAKLQGRIDSLNNLSLPAGKYRGKLDSVRQKSPLQKIPETTSKLSEAHSNVQDKVDRPLQKVNEKAAQLNSEAGGYGNLPANLNAPDISGDVPGASLPALKTPGQGLDNAAPGLQGITVPDANLDINTNLDINNRLQSGADNVGIGAEDVSKLPDAVSAYTQDAKAIGSGNLQEVKQLDKDALSKIPGDELAAAQGEISVATEQMETLKSLKNEDAFKKHATEKGREMVTQQIALQEQQIAQTVNKISKHQQRLGTVFSKVKGLPKRPLKQKKPPVIERIVPGITLQVQQDDLWWVDLTPSVHYRVRSIFSAGLGWNERVCFDNNFDFHKKARIFGPRSFLELSVLKGLWLRSEVERMNTFVPANDIQQDGARRNIWNYLVGIKKDFSFMGNVTGNVQFMYNLYDPYKISPQNRFNVRFGFEFPIRRHQSGLKTQEKR